MDPAEKHEPTLITPSPQGRARRLDFYRYAVDFAAELGSDCVSLWSGVLRADVARPQGMDWLLEGLGQVLSYAAARPVAVGLNPSPGMLVDSMQGYEELLSKSATRTSA